MEPVTLVLVGAAAYAYFKGKGAPIVHVSLPAEIHQVPPLAGHAGQPLSTGASGTHPDAPLSTNTGLVNPITLAEPKPPTVQVVPIPPLALVLDNDTALKMRAYATLDPEGFRIFLDRYAEYFVLREDSFVQMLTDPPAAGFQPTPGMIASMGAAAYKVVQGLNGVAAGNYGDIFGVASSAAGQIPMLNPDLLKSLQGLALAYRAFTAAMTIGDVASIAAANGVGIMDVTGTMLAAGDVASSMAMAPIASFAGVLMAAGLCVDIAFTIIGNEPDVQKAIDVALDVASLVCLFIPVIGWVVAIVIQLVKFIIDCFGSELFGGGMSRYQHDQIEAAKYGENLSPMWPILADSLTPRELFHHIIEWGSGYCGGVHIAAIAIYVQLHPGDIVSVAGHPRTITADVLLPFGSHGCYAHNEYGFAGITDDEQALALATYGSGENRIVATAQVGVMVSLKDQFETPTRNIIQARCVPMTNFVKHGVTLDGIDQIVAEFRAQKPLNAMAAFCSYTKWQDLLGFMLTDEWITWTSKHTHGSLHDFAVSLHQPSMYALRAAIFHDAQTAYQQAQQLLGATEDMVAWFNANMGVWPYQTLYGYTGVGPIALSDPPASPAQASVLDAIEARITHLESGTAAWQQQVALAAQWLSYYQSIPTM